MFGGKAMIVQYGEIHIFVVHNDAIAKRYQICLDGWESCRE
jgi:hypothetical protein